MNVEKTRLAPFDSRRATNASAVPASVVSIAFTSGNPSTWLERVRPLKVMSPSEAMASPLMWSTSWPPK